MKLLTELYKAFLDIEKVSTDISKIIGYLEAKNDISFIKREELKELNLSSDIKDETKYLKKEVDIL